MNTLLALNGVEFSLSLDEKPGIPLEGIELNQDEFTPMKDIDIFGLSEEVLESPVPTTLPSLGSDELLFGSLVRIFVL